MFSQIRYSDVRQYVKPLVRLEPTTGLEPVNLILTKDVLYLLSYVGLIRIPRKRFKYGAGNGTRTRDPQLGRLTL